MTESCDYGEVMVRGQNVVSEQNQMWVALGGYWCQCQAQGLRHKSMVQILVSDESTL